MSKFKTTGKADHEITKRKTFARFRQCSRKTKFNLRLAHRAVENLNSRQPRRVHAYFCDMCGSYHVGNAESKNKRAKFSRREYQN